MSRRSLPLLPRAALLLLALLALVAGCKKKVDPLTGADAAYQHTRTILSYGPRPPASPGLKHTRDYLVAQLVQHGWQVSAQEFKKDIRSVNQARGSSELIPRPFTNLIARFGSSADPDFWTRPVKGVLGAHIDSKYYPDREFLGADDAASAAAVILELARQLKSSPDLASRLELVFFDGEEAFGQNISPIDGLFGSKAYAARWRTAPQKPSFGIVLDMIGHKDLTIRYPSDTPPALERALMDSARLEGESARFTRGLTPIIDDHVPLNDAGIPTIDIIGDFSQFAWWHTEKDNLANISKESLAITLKVTKRMLEALLVAKEGAVGQ